MSNTAVWIAVLAFVLLAVIRGGGLPRTYGGRACQGRAWRRAFPADAKGEVRAFLTVFTEAFAFAEKHKLKFGPDDSIFSIYRVLYPYSWMADALELETLAHTIEAKYGLSLESLWSEDLTLGQLFARTRQPRSASDGQGI